MPLDTVCGDNEAFDLERRENNGIPYDIGWGPYCIESGWTVGEIVMGLQFMQLAVKIVDETYRE